MLRVVGPENTEYTRYHLFSSREINQVSGAQIVTDWLEYCPASEARLRDVFTAIVTGYSRQTIRARYASLMLAMNAISQSAKLTTNAPKSAWVDCYVELYRRNRICLAYDKAHPDCIIIHTLSAERRERVVPP